MNRIALIATSVLLVAVTACGGGGGGANTEQFSTDLDDICNPIRKDLADLGVPVALAEIGTTATKASRLIEEGVAEMRKLTIPTSNKTFLNDTNDLLDTFSSEVDALDDIASAAASADDFLTQEKIAKFEKLTDQANEIASDLGTRRCEFDALFGSALSPVDTTPIESTLPPETLPPVVDTVATVAPPVATDNKVIEDLAVQLVPAGAYTFVNSEDSLLQTFRDVLATTPIMAAQPGTIGAVDIIFDGVTFARVFAFAPTGTLTPDSAPQFATAIAAGQPTTLASFGGVDGVRWTTIDATEMFVGSLGDVVLWSVATNVVDLEAGVVDLIDSIV